ncbi:MAG: DEAD/DEAH box helicase [Myxococcota bacterium]|nr:DEAD/DEAH box helicase [Myxococcota bacterium]
MTDPSRDDETEQTPEAVDATPAEPAADTSAEPAADASAEAASSEDSIGETIVTSDYVSDRAFSDFPLSPEVLKSITEKGYTMATGVQAAAIEPAIAGRDLVVRSKTGTGKTAAFCIPMIERIAAGDRKTRAIVLAPTRELARQVAEECSALSQYKDIRVTVIYGGVGFGPQEEALKAGSEIVVGTPGRLLDHLRRGNLDLSEASFAALDEADEMLSMGFMQDVMKILDQTPKGRQVLMFSATVDDRVRSLITRYTTNALDIRLSTDTDKVEGITHVLYETSPNFHKVRALLALIDQEEPVSALIFCNTRADTGTVATFLARQGLDVELISGELPQNKREKVMDRVRSGQTQYLVATDVAARGIDISHLTHVLNYSLPDDPAVYLHRTGRVGRIGREGIAISLVGGQDIHTRNTLEKQYEIAFEKRPMPTPEEATAARVDRQAKAIKKAMGTMAFEGYLGTVRAIKKRPDGDLLLAAAMRAFFLWDRMRKAADGSTGESVEALQQARAEKKERRNDRDGGDRRRRRRRPNKR